MKAGMNGVYLCKFLTSITITGLCSSISRYFHPQRSVCWLPGSRPPTVPVSSVTCRMTQLRSANLRQPQPPARRAPGRGPYPNIHKS